MNQPRNFGPAGVSSDRAVSRLIVLRYLAVRVGCGICAQIGVDMSDLADIMTLRSEQTPTLKVA